MIVLGVESSCDDTGAAVLRDGRSCRTWSRRRRMCTVRGAASCRTRGAQPHPARRAGDRARARSGRRRLAEIDGIAATRGPGSSDRCWSACARRRRSRAVSACRSSASITSRTPAVDRARGGRRAPFLDLVVSGGTLCPLPGARRRQLRRARPDARRRRRRGVRQGGEAARPRLSRRTRDRGAGARRRCARAAAAASARQGAAST